MKKIFAFILVAFVFIASMQLTSYAETKDIDIPQDEIVNEETNETSDTTDDQATEQTNETTDSSTQENEENKSDETVVQPGIVKVIVNTQYFQKNIDSLTMSLSNDQNTYQSEIEKIDNAVTYSFKDVVNGSYTLTIQGKGYQTITQEVNVESNESVLKYMSTNQLAENTKESGFGTLLYGDFNSDGKIDSSDKEKILNQIYTSQYDEIMDIDSDEKVNLVDLQLFTYAYSDNANQVNTSQPIIETKPLLINNVSLESEGKIEGDIRNIFNDSDDSIQLKPSKEETISEDNPVQVSLNVAEAIETTELKIQGTKENAISEGTITITDENGEKYEAVLTSSKARVRSALKATVNEDGSIVVDLGTQIAVKKVVIRVTATSSSSLAEISKVEFLNNMEGHIPTPKLDVPTGLTVDELDATLNIRWNALNNVTKYKVKVTYNGESEEHEIDKNTYKLETFQNKDLLNGKTYQICVKAINDADKDSIWESEYCKEVSATPQATKCPDKPYEVSAVGAYRSIEVSWKEAKNTDSYNVYYREKGTEKYTQAVSGLTETTYTISSLKENTTYQVYVTACNKIGEGKGSDISEATTLSIKPAILPEYKMLNTPTGVGNLTSHVKNVTYGYNTAIHVIGSSLDEGKENSALALVDNDYNSYAQINDWDYGVSYHPEWRFTFEFDQVYEMNYVTFAGPINDPHITKVSISYIDESGKEQEANVNTFRHLTDKNGRQYYMAYLKDAVKTNKLRFGIQSSERGIRLAEFRFHYYDSLDGDVNALFDDSYHLSLNKDVTEDKIDALETRLNTVDETSNEYHPFKDLIQKEIDQARTVLAGTALQDIQEIHNGITTGKQGNLGISGLNSWQPLGYVVNSDEKNITLYVGQTGKYNGDSVNLQLVYSQYHAESSKLVSQPISLKVGKNVINLTEYPSLSAENGGSLYVQYTGNSDEKIGVRVVGGHKISTLDLYKVEKEDERLSLVKTYLEALQTQIKNVETNHNEYHKDDQYDEKNCTLGATEIMLDHMLYSVSGQQILAGLTGSTIDEKAEQLLKSLDAMDQMMELFYQNKGLNDVEDTKKDDKENNYYPAQHLNIRYQRMFPGAFMYAASNHIGIEWNEVKGLTGGTPFTATENGKYISGNTFGWGIAHEIGHNINQNSYAIAEITNNFFSLLSQNQDTNDTTRFKYSDVYKKVTSGAEGRDSNVFTQLAMYWQLHLAYDQNYHYKLYDSYAEQMNALFYARVDHYARYPGQFTPKENGVALSLNSTAEQNFVRLACAAADKDLTDFFKAWGITPNADTKAFISQFDKETRALQYLDDDSFSYRLENNASMSSDTSVKATLQNDKNSNQVTLTITNTNSVNNAMLGYEILRNGKVVGFVNAQNGETTFTDTVSTLNNRVITYSVVGYDRLLNQTSSYTLSPIKISHDGSLDKQNWSIETNMTSSSDASTGSESETPCTPTKNAIASLIDNNYKNVYTGTSEGNSEVIVSLNTVADITGVKLTNPSFDKVKVYVSDDKEQWTLVKEDDVEKGQENKLYFSQIVNDELQNNKSLVSYSSSYVKLVVEDKEVSLSEIDVLGPTGDNVDLEQNGIGILKEDYQLDENNIIPQGSLIFTGTYSGNPAYNVVELKDENNHIISGYQVIFAEDPGDKDLADVSGGTWVYYLEPEKDSQKNIIPNSFGYYDENKKFVKVELPTQVKAELYRVNDAQTNEGQRLVSDSYDVQLPSTIPSISLSNQKKGGQ